MPVYEYECQRCGDFEKMVSSMKDHQPVVDCDCGGKAKQVFNSPSNITLDWAPFWAEHMSHEGVWVTSRRHHNEELKKRGLVAVG